MSYSKQFSVESLAKFYAREEHESCVIPITIFTCHVIVKGSLPAETLAALKAREGLVTSCRYSHHHVYTPCDS